MDVAQGSKNTGIKYKQRNKLDKTLFLEVLVSLTIIDVTLFVLQLLHGFLLEDLVATFTLELFSDYSERQIQIKVPLGI